MSETGMGSGIILGCSNLIKVNFSLVPVSVWRTAKNHSATSGNKKRKTHFSSLRASYTCQIDQPWTNLVLALLL